MNKFIFVKKDVFDGFSDRIKNEFIHNSKINNKIPIHEIDSVDYYCFEFCEDISKTKYVYSYPFYTEEEAAKIIEASLPLDTSEMILIPNEAPFKSKVLKNGKKLFKRLHGSDILEVPANDIGIIELDIGYPHVKMNAIDIINCAVGDKASLFVMDTAAGTYSGIPDYELNNFGIDVNMPKDSYSHACNYDADLYYGMIIRVEYENNNSSPRPISFNANLSEVRQ